MNQEFIIYLGSRALFIMAEVAGPILIGSLVTGVVVAVFQSITQIQEATLTFIPKIIVAALLLLVLGSWMGSKIIGFTIELFQSIPAVIG
ncbi:MAG: flagellar biosynthesis protein FliQ [Actinobacteria bacterium]|nr:flagellar biosynthesis protein FliQ [Actinomycetota bacterium]